MLPDARSLLRVAGRRAGVFFCFLLLVTLGVGVTATAFADPPPAQSSAAPVTADDGEDRRESIGRWADSTFETLLSNNQITGAVVSVVQDGEIIHERGYGVANVVTGEAADPHRTRVRIGSTTKTFTATIIAQLMDEGVIETLDDPVNRYLDRYQLPDNDGVPITLRHLLTHSAGFEDRFFFIGSDRPVDIPVRPELFDTLRPAYARPAGDRVVYSNFGVAVLGLVIEDLTGMSIDEAMRRRIFAPLGMTNTELAVSIEEPAGLAFPGLIDGTGETTGPVPFVAINPAVAQTGSIVSTAGDMARYMNAQLGNGDVLNAAIRTRLHRRIESNDEQLNGIGMVFFVDQWAGRTTIAHGGNWAGFHTWMVLLPEEGLGFFVTLLGDAQPTGLVSQLIGAAFPGRAAPPSPAMLSAASMSDRFLAELFGPKRAAPQSAALSLEDLNRYTGYFRADRRPFTTVEELSSLVYFGAEVVQVTAQADGLYLNGTGPWVPTGEGRFVLDAGTRPMMVIAPHPETGILTLHPDIGIYTFSRIAAWQHPGTQSLVLHILLLLSLVGLFVPLLMRRTWLAVAPFAIGLTGATMLGCLFVGYEPGATMMTGYFAGHLSRIIVFVGAAHLMLIAGLASLVLPLTRSMARRWKLTFIALGLNSVVIAVILFQYNAILPMRF